MSNEKYFHFTIGPVQSFVGQARRTRDFWAGSFLLSWLSGVAMLSVEKQKDCEIEFPKADKKFLDAISNGCSEVNKEDKEQDKEQNKKEDNPKQGSIPNRFKAKVYAGFDPQKVVDDVQDAWKELADIIYKKEVEDKVADNPETAEIWARQVNDFWDITWVLVDDKNDSSSLDCRKNWRTNFMPMESGVKCSLMGDWQELSGCKDNDRQNREKFWAKFAKSNPSDFSEKEHLCAMAFIKRRFVKYFPEVSLNKDDLKIHGWKPSINVPSVAYLAAATWFAKVLKDEKDTDELNQFISAAKGLAGLSEYSTSIKSIGEACSDNKINGIDGNCFHIHELENANTFPDRYKANEVKRALNKLIEKHGKISPFYAVLMMDGDSLGKQMSDINKQDDITNGLNAFTGEVHRIVCEDHDGFLIYAGGDDVLALVTLEDALGCAAKIRKCYEKEFKKYPKINTSISAAIIYNHIGAPLKNILHEAHSLLDDVAKEAAGRDALAVRVYKGSGFSCEWAKKWDDALAVSDNDGKKFELEIEEIVYRFNKEQSSDDRISNKFFYKIRERFNLIYPKDQANNDHISIEEAKDLMAMEYVQSCGSKLKFDDARKSIDKLMEQSKNKAVKDRITADAALLIRFLAQKGIDGGQS